MKEQRRGRLMLAALWVLGGLSTGCGKPEQRASDAPAPPAAANPPAAAPAPPATPAAVSDGAAVFARTCQTCHQATGQGMPNVFPPLAGSPIVQGDKGRLVRLVLHGLRGPITVAGKQYNSMMPPWKSLSDADMAAVLTYARSHFGNNAAAVTAAEVARERAATASRATMWTAAELGIH